MPFKAVILSVCSLLYLLELLLIPVFYRPAVLHNHGVSAKVKPACCRRQVATTPCQPPDQEACCKTTCCLNCPLANAAVISEGAGINENLQDVERVYPRYFRMYRYAFYADHWKPPASCS